MTWEDMLKTYELLDVFPESSTGDYLEISNFNRC